MHVLQVIEATIGGTRRHVVDLSRGLARAGVEVSLVASCEREPRFRGDLERLARDGVRVRELAMLRPIRPGRDFAHVRALERHLRELRPDVVHTHSSKAGVLGRLASLSTGIGARVHTPHTFAFLFGAMFPAPQRALFREIERALAGATQRVIAVSADEAESFLASGVVAAERIRVVPNGVDAATWIAARPADRAALGAPDGAPLAALVGLLNVAKGQDVALRALAEPGLERLHLAVAGDGETRAELEELARASRVADRTHFLGWRDDVPAIVAASDFALVPSRWEGMPYIALEAAAAGRPVVATRVDGARSLVEEGRTGFLADVGSVASLAAAVRSMLALTEGERAELGRRARERVAGELTLERMVERALGVYGEVA